MVPGSTDTGPHGSGLPPAGVSSPTGGGGGLADALAVALNKRKQKVSASGKQIWNPSYEWRLTFYYR